MNLRACIRSRSIYCLGMARCYRVRIPGAWLTALMFLAEGIALWLLCPFRWWRVPKPGMIHWSERFGMEWQEPTEVK